MYPGSLFNVLLINDWSYIQSLSPCIIGTSNICKHNNLAEQPRTLFTDGIEPSEEKTSNQWLRCAP